MFELSGFYCRAWPRAGRPTQWGLLGPVREAAREPRHVLSTLLGASMGPGHRMTPAGCPPF